MPKRQDLKALRNLISEAEIILSTTTLPEGRAQRAGELLRSAVILANTLLETAPAVSMGRKGGKTTAKRGPDYFRKIAALRKTRSGGRPKKTDI